MLFDAASRESFVVLVHGMIGCGKTFLVSSTLRDEKELIGRAFDDMIWLNDGRGDAGALLRLMLCKLSGGEEEEKLQWQTRPDMADDLLVVAVKRAMLSRPNCLLVVDHVRSESIVRCLSDLKCRVLTTSHNREIFNLCANELFQIEMDNGYSDEEIWQVIRQRHKADEEILSSLKTIGANPAFINILLEKTARDPSMLKQLCRQIHQWPLSDFRCTTAYQFSTMDEALCQSYDQLNEEQRRCLICLAQFPLNMPISIRNIASSLTTGTVGMNEQDEQASIKIWCIVHELEQRHWVICCSRSEEGRSGTGASCSSRSEEGRSLNDAGYSLHPLISKFVKNTTAFINAIRSESVIKEQLDQGNDRRLNGRIRHETDL